jgi:hypothetical protein
MGTLEFIIDTEIDAEYLRLWKLRVGSLNAIWRMALSDIQPPPQGSEVVKEFETKGPEAIQAALADALRNLQRLA